MAHTRIGAIDAAIDQLAVRNWSATRAALEIEARQRDNHGRSAELLLTTGGVPEIRQTIDTNRGEIATHLENLQKIATEPEAATKVRELTESLAAYSAELDRFLTAYEAGERTRASAVYGDALAAAFARSTAAIDGLAQGEESKLAADLAAARAFAEESKARLTRIAMIAGVVGVALTLLVGISLAVRLRRAAAIADAVAQGRYDNEVIVSGSDETGQVLASLEHMQSVLRTSRAQDLDSRGQLAAIGKAQAIIEFEVDGRIIRANENFMKAFGYDQAAIQGQHHRMLVDPAYAASADYRGLWDRLARGEFVDGQFKRFGRGGREIWLQASYNPILDEHGKVIKVVKFATDITEQKTRNADFEGQIGAINASQAVIEFDMDGTIRRINDNFTQTMGYSSGEVVGKHHSLFAEPAYAASSEYRAFWAALNQGEFQVGTFRRLGKGGREVWMSAAYSPIKDASGKPFKVVKYATDVTEATRTARQLQVAVEKTQEAIKQALDGNLTFRVPTEGMSGDIGAMCYGVNSLLDSTRELVRRVKLAVGEVHTGAEEISRGNLNLSQRTEEQASSLEETASSMEQMTSTVKQTADNAGQANQLAVAAREQAEKGGKVVGAAVAAMSGINASSKKIADIIGVIDEIAFQTNLLALNAAVEAARAGEQGRGFAVVATEVRNLAGRSATAAKEIKSLIQDSVGKVEEGSKLVDDSGKTLEEINQAVKKVTDIVAEIAAASREQSSGIEQVNKAVMQMDETTQQNAALVEQAAAASQAIVEQSQALAGLVSKYQVGEAASIAAPSQVAPGGVERRGEQRPWSNPAAKAVKVSKPANPVANVKVAARGGDADWKEF